jgi:hypothetical protein
VTLPVAMSVRELLLAIGRFLDDARLLKATLFDSTTTHYVSRALAYGADNRYIGSELFVWDMPGDATGDNPFTVASSTGSSGTLILSQSVGPTAFPIGTRAVLQNIGGKGFPHDRRAWALQMALAEHEGQSDAQVTITSPNQTNWWNAIPAGIRSITGVVQVDPSGLTRDIANAAWQENLDLPGRRILLPYSLDTGWTYIVAGRADLAYPFATDPPDYTALVQVAPDRLVKDAVKWLYLGSRAVRGQEIASNLYNDRLRTARNAPRPGEVFLP